MVGVSNLPRISELDIVRSDIDGRTLALRVGLRVNPGRVRTLLHEPRLDNRVDHSAPLGIVLEVKRGLVTPLQDSVDLPQLQRRAVRRRDRRGDNRLPLDATHIHATRFRVQDISRVETGEDIGGSDGVGELNEILHGSTFHNFGSDRVGYDASRRRYTLRDEMLGYPAGNKAGRGYPITVTP